jgi:predicted Zn-dependent peptidase
MIAGPAAAQASTEPLPPNPFAGFESFRLANGLKVWYRHAPGAMLASMAVIVPYGRDQDPPGKEQTAHLLEHVLLSDRSGGSEAELIRELTARGGTFSGVTGPHYTLFPISIESAHAASGVQWLHDVIAPRVFHDDLVSRNRGPVAIEMEGRRRPLLRGIPGQLLDHPRMHPPGFWKREFGYAAHEERRADETVTLGRISARDVQRYYDTYYAPSAMTLVIIAGAPRAQLQEIIEGTFGALPWRPVPELAGAGNVRTKASTRFVHAVGRGTRITLAWRLPEIDGRDHLRLAFLEDLLRYRLTERLRNGEVKSVYGVSTSTELRGTAALFTIFIDVSPRDEMRVREIIGLELDRLRNATADSTAFYADRDVLSRSLRMEHASPAALRGWAMRRAWRPDLHDAFPDVGEYYATVGADSLAAFSARTFTHDRSITSIARPLPLPALLLALLAAAAGLLAVPLYRSAVFRPADMRSLRFVARLRQPAAVRIIITLGGAAAGIAALRLVVAVAHVAAERWVLVYDSFPLAAAATGVLIFLTTAAALAVTGSLPAKVLVFDDEIRLKSRTYRSLTIPASRVLSAFPARERRLARVRRPALVTRRTVAIELDDGSGYLLDVRDPEGLIAAVLDVARPTHAATAAVESAAAPGPGLEPATSAS